VDAMRWDEDARLWHLEIRDAEPVTARFVISCIGVLNIPTLPRIEGIDDFEGPSFHTYWWPKEPVDLAGKRVGVVGTGATAIQVIAAIADTVGELKVFQRRPNWSCPLNNSEISEAEMAEIRARYDEIFANCEASPGGFEHVPDRRGFWNFTPEERRAFWDELYEQPGFAILQSNFVEIFADEAANREISDYIADRIRERVDDPETAEKLIPTDHGFGTQRLPLESGHFEAYNRDHVHLISLQETPITRVTATGIETSAEHHELDVIVYATGFDAITGGFDRIDVRGTDGRSLREEWRRAPHTWYGVLSNGFPNLLMVAGPQSISGSTNFPRAIEHGVDWVTRFLETMRAEGATRFEVSAEGEREWAEEVAKAYDRVLLKSSKGWFTGYNSNVEGHEEGVIRHQAYFGPGPKYRKLVERVAAEGYPQVARDAGDDAPGGARAAG